LEQLWPSVPVWFRVRTPKHIDQTVQAALAQAQRLKCVKMRVAEARRRVNRRDDLRIVLLAQEQRRELRVKYGPRKACSHEQSGELCSHALRVVRRSGEMYQVIAHGRVAVVSKDKANGRTDERNERRHHHGEPQRGEPEPGGGQTLSGLQLSSAIRSLVVQGDPSCS
jgi:hypothetical protein